MLISITRFCAYHRVISKNPTAARLLLIRNFHKEHIPVAWEKPKVGWTKLNFDGSFRERTGKATIGGVFRDHNADFMLGYAEPIGKTDSTVAELAALLRGLELILENGWNDVWLEGDAKALVKIITPCYGKCNTMSSKNKPLSTNISLHAIEMLITEPFIIARNNTTTRT